MTHVRHFYVDNLDGDLQGTITAANAKNGAVYPPGSVVQLVPGEAMVKLDKGASPATRDWEYFELDVSKDGTRISPSRLRRCHQPPRRQLLRLPRGRAPRMRFHLRDGPRLRADSG
jgi:hypothetical protein